MADATKIRETIERSWAAFCTNDRDPYLGGLADDAWIEDPLGTLAATARATSPHSSTSPTGSPIRSRSLAGS